MEAQEQRNGKFCHIQFIDGNYGASRAQKDNAHEKPKEKKP